MIPRAGYCPVHKTPMGQRSRRVASGKMVGTSFCSVCDFDEKVKQGADTSVLEKWLCPECGYKNTGPIKSEWSNTICELCNRIQSIPDVFRANLGKKCREKDKAVHAAVEKIAREMVGATKPKNIVIQKVTDFKPKKGRKEAMLFTVAITGRREVPKKRADDRKAVEEFIIIAPYHLCQIEGGAYKVLREELLVQHAEAIKKAKPLRGTVEVYLNPFDVA